MDNKQNGLMGRITDSLKLAAAAVVVGLVFKLLDATEGVLIALAMVAVLAAIIPFYRERQRVTRARWIRFRALTAIQELHEAISLHREWVPCQQTLADMKDRFSYAQKRA